MANSPVVLLTNSGQELIGPWGRQSWITTSEALP